MKGSADGHEVVVVPKNSKNNSFRTT